MTDGEKLLAWIDSLGPKERARAAATVDRWLRLNRAQRRGEGIKDNRETLEAIKYILRERR